MIFDNSKCFAEKIDQDLHANGAQTANKLLLEAFSSSTVNQQQLVNELEKKGDMKELAVQFLIDPNIRRKYDTSGDGALNYAELNQAHENIKIKMAYGKTTAEDHYEAAMLNVLKSKYEQIKGAHNDREGGFLRLGTHEKDAITYNDMSKVLTDANKSRQDEKILEDNREAMRVLLRSDIPMFKILDATKNGKEDNKISKDDLDRYLSNYDRRTNNGTNEAAKCGEYTEEIHTAVKNLRDNWDREPVSRLRETVNVPASRGQYATVPGDYITTSSLAQAGGFGNQAKIESLIQTYGEESEKAAAERAAKLSCASMGAENMAPDRDRVREGQNRLADGERPVGRDRTDADAYDCFNPNRETINTKRCPTPDVVRTLTASKGNGPWSVAEHLLGQEAPAVEVLKLARQIRDEYEATHGGKGSAARIKTNERWLTDEQWQKLVESNDKLKAKYAK